ncbi:hypothetical protein PENTCL1PPCAC_23966, partial [Pristionchus entomophagus]
PIAEMIVLILAGFVISAVEAEVVIKSTSSCQSDSKICFNGVCKKTSNANCGGPSTGNKNNSTLVINSTSEVITCDESSLFSSYSICAPGVCCSNIPMGIRGSIFVLTDAVVVLTVMVLRSNNASSTRVNTEPSAKDNACEAPKEDPQLPSIQPQPMVNRPSISNPTPSFHPSLQAV